MVKTYDNQTNSLLDHFQFKDVAKATTRGSELFVKGEYLLDETETNYLGGLKIFFGMKLWQ